MSARNGRVQLVAVLVTLVLLHFYVRPRLFDGRLAPDFLLFALVIFAMRSGPGAGAVAGFLVGLATDALSPARFGAATLADTIVGYAAAWGRAVFFADNLLVNAGFVAAGCGSATSSCWSRAELRRGSSCWSSVSTARSRRSPRPRRAPSCCTPSASGSP